MNHIFSVLKVDHSEGISHNIIWRKEPKMNNAFSVPKVDHSGQNLNESEESVNVTLLC